MGEHSELILGVAASEPPDKASFGAGMFPIYVPGYHHQLGVWPCSSDRLILPNEPAKVQPGPAIALRCRLVYDEDDTSDRVTHLVPYAFAASDDTTLHSDEPKAHQTRNWGPHCKGLSNQWLAIDRFDETGVMARFRLASFMTRAGRVFDYGEDTHLTQHTARGAQLIEWMVSRLRDQVDDGALDDLPSLIRIGLHPPQAIIHLRSSDFTEFGRSMHLRPDDEVAVVVYDGQLHDLPGVRDAIRHHAPLAHASMLRRRVFSSTTRPIARN